MGLTEKVIGEKENAVDGAGGVAAGQELHYYDISFTRTKGGPVGVARRADMESVIQWLRKNEGRLNFVLVMVMPGEMPGLPDKESII